MRKREDTTRAKDKASKLCAGKRRHPHSALRYPIDQNAGTGAVRVLREVDQHSDDYSNKMQALAKSLPNIGCQAMGGVGNDPAPKLIAEIGDVRRFIAESLIAHAGIDVASISIRAVIEQREISTRSIFRSA